MLIVLGKKFAVVKSSNLHYLSQGKGESFLKQSSRHFYFKKTYFDVQEISNLQILIILRLISV